MSSIGNPIFTGAFLLMVTPIILALALKSNGASGSPIWSLWWIIPLTIPVLGMAFTLARGPWAGLAVGLATLLALLGIAMEWRNSFRALMMSAAAIAITWSIVTFIPTPAGGADLAPRALSVGSAVISSLTAETPDSQAQTMTPKPHSRLAWRHVCFCGRAPPVWP